MPRISTGNFFSHFQEQAESNEKPAVPTIHSLVDSLHGYWSAMNEYLDEQRQNIVRCVCSYVGVAFVPPPPNYITVYNFYLWYKDTLIGCVQINGNAAAYGYDDTVRPAWLAGFALTYVEDNTTARANYYAFLRDNDLSEWNTGFGLTDFESVCDQIKLLEADVTYYWRKADTTSYETPPEDEISEEVELVQPAQDENVDQFAEPYNPTPGGFQYVPRYHMAGHGTLSFYVPNGYSIRSKLMDSIINEIPYLEQRVAFIYLSNPVNVIGGPVQFWQTSQNYLGKEPPGFATDAASTFIMLAAQEYVSFAQQDQMRPLIVDSPEAKQAMGALSRKVKASASLTKQKIYLFTFYQIYEIFADAFIPVTLKNFITLSQALEQASGGSSPPIG